MRGGHQQEILMQSLNENLFKQDAIFVEMVTLRVKKKLLISFL